MRAWSAGVLGGSESLRFSRLVLLDFWSYCSSVWSLVPVSQEINFWLSKERALENIENQLRSEEVNMVMDCLRNAKRFLATVSFIADTGLKDASDDGKTFSSVHLAVLSY